MTESEYQVVWPLGRSAVQKIEVTSGVEGLDGKKVAFVWDYLFRGPEIFDAIKSEITARYPDGPVHRLRGVRQHPRLGRGGEGEPRTAARAHARARRRRCGGRGRRLRQLHARRVAGDGSARGGWDSGRADCLVRV